MRFLISAGPTREHLDPVRFLSNRSSGKMGFAIAAAAADLGHRVRLVAGPVTLPTPAGVERENITSALEMLDAIRRNLENCDCLVMCAAVADWRPRQCSPRKLKKNSMGNSIALAPNPDILKTLRPLKGARIFVGFSAETGDPIPEAQRKLREKQLDMIVANDVSQPDAGFEVDTNRAALVTRDSVATLPLLSKYDLGREIVAWCQRGLSPLV